MSSGVTKPHQCQRHPDPSPELGSLYRGLVVLKSNPKLGLNVLSRSFKVSIFRAGFWELAMVLCGSLGQVLMFVVSFCFRLCLGQAYLSLLSSFTKSNHVSLSHLFLFKGRLIEVLTALFGSSFSKACPELHSNLGNACFVRSQVLSPKVHCMDFKSQASLKLWSVLLTSHWFTILWSLTALGRSWSVVHVNGFAVQ